MASAAAEIRCLNCGRFLGEVAEREGRLRLVRRGQDGLVPRIVRGRLRCSLCGGRAWLEQT